jgi:nitrogen-specific signal transduction histidine kinase/ActR/RegA family two-component response regulator
MDQELLAQPGVRSYEMKSTRCDGSVRYDLNKKATLPGNDGSVGGIVGVIIDISEQKRMEEDILKAKNLQSLGTLAGGIAHDFNNLLMAIVGNLSLARMNTPDNGRLMDYLNEAERIAFLGKSLTQQLLTFSRGGNPVRSIVQPGSLVSSVAARVLSGFPVDCVYDIPPDILPIEADEDQIRQVVENILRNARESMPAGGRITITIRNVSISPEDKLPLMEEDHVRVSISDEGAGIAPEDIPKVFDPYYTTKGMGSEKGVGLGLAISYAIIRKHNGSISIESVKGRGSVFHINLPAYKHEVAREAASAGRPAGEREGRVLLLDDEELVLEIGKELLGYLGYSVTTAQNGEEAVALYKQAEELKSPFDAVILDLAIPGGLGGKEALRELMRIDPKVKAIISSGYLNDPVVADYREYGFQDVLTKPYDSNELDEKLKKVIGR